MSATLEDKQLHATLSIITNFILTGPTFSNDSSISIAENNSSALTVELKTTDTVTYAIRDGNSSLFDINATTGVVTFKTPPDYESGDILYTFTVIATDSKGDDYTQEVTIHITNVAEVIPVLLEQNSTKILTFSDFSFFGDAFWLEESNNTYRNLDINDSQISCLMHIVNQGGILYFEWAVDSLGGSDFLQFYIDDEVQDNISGSIGFLKVKSYTVSKNSEVKWCYTKDNDSLNELDRGWIRAVEIKEFYNIDENTSVGESVAFVSIQPINDSAIKSFSLEGNGTELFSIESSGEIKLASKVDYESKKNYYLTTTATNEAGTSNRVDVNISIINDKNDLYIQNAIYDNNNTMTISDDRIKVYFSKSIEENTLSTDRFTIYGNGVIDGIGEYNSNWLRYDINLTNFATALDKEDNISIDNLVSASDGYALYYETKTPIEGSNKFARRKTGQTTTYEVNDDGSLSRGWNLSYTDNGNGTITDNNTGLIWQKEDDNNTYTYNGAISYCEGLDLGSSMNWRLSTVDELVSITDKSRVNPSINPIFTNTNSSVYWGTKLSGNASAWGIDFSFGHDSVNGKIYSYVVRCVRDGQ
jgi:hypothetical protein